MRPSIPFPAIHELAHHQVLTNQTNSPRISVKRQSKLDVSPSDDNVSCKRVKLTPPEEILPSSRDDDLSDSDTEMEPLEMLRYRARLRRSAGPSMRHENLPLGYRAPLPETRCFLRSFVSSNKADVFKCEARETGYALTVPYACAYSYGARRGRNALLAIGTEAGSIHILNTTKRNDWDPEPERTTIQSHTNGIFDLKWDPSDTLIATASADQTTCIIRAETSTTTHRLQGHSSTVKCLAWDPTHPDLITTGSRDGSLCFWDLRVSEGQDEGMLQPVHTISKAQEDTSKPKPKGRKSKTLVSASLTGVLYQEVDPFRVITSGSANGKLKAWDTRCLSTNTKAKAPYELCMSSTDPTTSFNSSRPRGITAITQGTGPTNGLVFAAGFDSRIHVYDTQTLTPQLASYSQDSMMTASFYVRTSLSPCGRWLACGSSAKDGRAYIFDVSNAARPRSTYSYNPSGVELSGQLGEVGAVDFGLDMLATCADEGTIRVWRPDIEVERRCRDNQEEERWNWCWADSR